VRALSLAFLALSGSACGTSEQDSACQRLESAWSVEALPAPAAACAAPTAPRDLSTNAKLAVAVYHFNIQYVAGGLRGFPDGNIIPKFDLGEVEIEDLIVKQGLEPALDLFLAEPSFHADLEMQAYTVEVLAARHPAVLEKLRTLALRGQVEVDSFHYSDQLYVAYPALDLERSLDLTKLVFDRACLPLGTSIFTQEGQFARGQIPIASARGYGVSVLPKNLFEYQFGEPSPVLYAVPEHPEHPVLIGGRGFSAADAPGGPFELAWTFMDDGEVAFSVNRLNPYFGTDYVADPEKLAAHRQRLMDMEAAGFVHATIREAVTAMKKRGIAATPLPPALDGTWQPDDTQNVLRWMGGAGLFRTFERDSEILAAVWRGRTLAELADRLVDHDDVKLAAGLRAAWRESALSAVSDATGWNPFRTEIAYAFEHAQRASELAQDVLRCAGKTIQSAPWTCAVGAAVAPDSIGVEVRTYAPRFQTTAHECTNVSGGQRIVEIIVEAPSLVAEEPTLEASEADGLQRSLEIRAQTNAKTFTLVPGLSDAPIVVDPAQYTFPWIAVPISLGLISVGPERWILQDQSTARVAALIPGAQGVQSSTVVRFVDQTVSRALPTRRRYLWLDGHDAADAVKLAEEIQRPWRE